MDRHPSTTAGAYSPPSGIGFGQSVAEVRHSTVREFGRLAEVFRRFPAIAVNNIPNLWIPGVMLSLASSGTAPTAGVRGQFPVSVYAITEEHSGTISTRVVVPGTYTMRLAWSVDAPGTAVVRWDNSVGIMGSEGAADAEPVEMGAGAEYGISVAATAVDGLMWTTFGSILVSDPAALGITIGRDPTTAPDTAGAEAFVVGIALERTTPNG
ncbi:MAG TPA: hypothetical protein VGC81_16305 [Candidatus Methylomirabilis sp.]